MHRMHRGHRDCCRRLVGPLINKLTGTKRCQCLIKKNFTQQNVRIGESNEIEKNICNGLIDKR